MGRPRKEREQKRILRINLRFTGEEYKLLEDVSISCGLPVYILIREKLLNGRFPKPKAAKVDLAVYLELKKIGVNVNQLARHANAGKFPFGILTVLNKLMEQQQFIIKLLLHDSSSENR